MTECLCPICLSTQLAQIDREGLTWRCRRCGSLLGELLEIPVPPAEWLQWIEAAEAPYARVKPE